MLKLANRGGPSLMESQAPLSKMRSAAMCFNCPGVLLRASLRFVALVTLSLVLASASSAAAQQPDPAPAAPPVTPDPAPDAGPAAPTQRAPVLPVAPTP